MIIECPVWTYLLIEIPTTVPLFVAREHKTKLVRIASLSSLLSPLSSLLSPLSQQQPTSSSAGEVLGMGKKGLRRRDGLKMTTREGQLWLDARDGGEGGCSNDRRGAVVADTRCVLYAVAGGK
eukprot:290012-Rhodomonas_salina.1